MRAATIVAGRFEIGSLAGAGGMGSVYRARDVTTGSAVAIKVVRQPSAEAAARFEREAQVLSFLGHPGIVTYIAHGQTDERDMFLVMEWLEGESLSERLSQKGLTLAETVTLGRRIAEALGFAHASGVVHRDVKPSNVLLPNGRIELAKLVDFGIAHLASHGSEITRTGVMVGTPAYIAPEQARGERTVDARADVFSLGAVLYKCLTGRPPFSAEDPFALLLKVISEPVTPPLLVRPEVPLELDRLIVRMLSKAPENRPRDGAHVAAEIDALAPFGDLVPPPSRGRGPILAEGDRKMISLVAIAWEEADEAEAIGATLSAIAERHRGVLLKKGPGQWAISLGEGGKDNTSTGGRTTLDLLLSPMDLASRAALCALAIRAAALTLARVALASGRFTREEPFPAALLSGAFDLLDPEAGKPIRMDDMTASLLDARFNVTRDSGRLSLVGERGDAEIGRTLLGRATPCVGREQELVTVEAAITTSVEEHVARAVLVLGAAGMGKSRLRAELLRRLRQRGSPLTVWGAAGDAMGQSAAFSLAGAVLRRALDLGATRDPGASLSAAMARRFQGPDRVRMTEMLAVLAGISPPGEPSPKLRAARRDARLMADQLRLAWEDFVAAECARSPVLLVVEDIQWADAASVDLLDAALRRMQGGPLTVLALGRPETLDVFPGLFRSRDVQEIRLGPLSKKASERLVRDVLEGRLTDDEIALIAARAGGNAFYLEELIRAASEGRGAALPESVRAMIEARLSTLDAVARRIVRAGSVLGQSFWRGGVRAILKDDVTEEALDEHLAELVRREVIVRRPVSQFADDAEYAFRHALVCDAAYATLSPEVIPWVHRIAADWLLSAGERRGGVIAEHFERAGNPERATTAYLRAAEQALEASDAVSAMRWAERAIASGAAGESLGRALWLQAEGHNWGGSLAKAESAATEAMQHLPRGSAAFFSAAMEAVLATARSGHIEALLQLIPTLLDTPAEEGAFGERVQAAANAAIQLLMRARYADADRVFSWLESTAQHAEAEDPKATGPVAEARAWRALFGGDPAQYLLLNGVAVRAYDDIGDVRNGARALMNVGYGSMLIGDYDGALEALTSALPQSERLGAAANVVRHNLGLVLAHLGRMDEAVAMERSAFEKTEPANIRMRLACDLYLAQIFWMAGRFEEAERHVEPVAAVEGQPALAAYGLAVQAMVRLQLGRLDEAKKGALRAAELLSLVKRIDEGEALIRLARAEVLRASGEHEGARQAVAEAWARLLERAARLADPTARERFLSRVPENARTAALAAEYKLYGDG